MGEKTQAKNVAAKAIEEFAPVKEQSQWELGWYVSNAFFLEDNKALNEATAERERRKQAKAEEPPDDDTPRPVVKGNLVLFKRTSAA